MDHGSVLRNQSVLPASVGANVAVCADRFGRIDVITAGFPCQPHSTASRGRRVARDWWPETLGVVRRFRPVWVVLENVPGARLEHIDRACSELDAEDFTVWPIVVGAEVRNHVRRRCWVVAHANREGEPQRSIDAQVARICEVAARRGCESESLGVDDGLPGWSHRMHALGNAIETPIAELIAIVLSGG